MGKGKDQTTNVVAGGCCAICCGICFLVLGLPMLIAGIVMVKLYEGDYDDQLNQARMDDPEFNDLDDQTIDDAKEILYKVGIALIVVAVICVVVGIVMVVLLCTGCCGRTNRNNAPSHVTVTQQYAVAQPGYNPNQPMQQSPPQGGYYPQGQQPPSYDYPVKA